MPHMCLNYKESDFAVIVLGAHLKEILAGKKVENEKTQHRLKVMIGSDNLSV